MRLLVRALCPGPSNSPRTAGNYYNILQGMARYADQLLKLDLAVLVISVVTLVTLTLVTLVILNKSKSTSRS